MPQFQYEVKKGPGEATTGVLEAESRRAALARLRDMGYVPVSIVEYTGAAKRDALRSAFVRIRLKDRNIFFRQLATLLDSGMPLTRALSTLVQQTENPKLSAIIDQVRDDVQKGSTFAEAMERHPKLFTSMHCSLVRAGESGGMLEDVLWRITSFGEQDEELRGKAISAMIYPAFLLVMGSLAIFILVSFVFPKFIKVFDDFNATLPLITQIVLAFCGFMGNFWWAILLGLIAMVVGFLSWVRSEKGRMQYDTFLLRVPVLRVVVQKYVMAQFARMLGTLLDNGVPILHSLQIAVDTLGNKAIAQEVGVVRERVAEGDSISSGLALTRHFPPMVVNMFAVGEESGRIGAVTKRMADAYDVEVDRAVKAMTSLLEPVLIVIMAIIVGILVISMLYPMLTLSSNVV
ncbi:MAG: type II secretion system F family protein [Candidatus Hydrogenedentes bacterium]|nr:type II secretion system F family protein [Candidatus Hydrogenedentota bacterium]